LRVAVLSGGRSSEHDVSLASGAAVRAGLTDGGHEVVDVRLEKDGGWTLHGEELSLSPGRGLAGTDVVFPVLHGPFGEDGSVQGLLELLDVPYVGAGVLGSAVAMDKAVFKDLMAAHGIPQVEYVAVREGAPVALAPPAFVKPARLGSSVGISKAWSEADLDSALAHAFEHDPVALVERFSNGLEVECSVLGHADPVASQPGEIVIQKGDWYDYEAKYEPGGMDLVVPARIPAEQLEEVGRLAVEVFRLVNCSGMARVDFFVEDEAVLVNELNTIPGFTSTSVYAKLFEASGIPYVELLDRLLALARERYEEERRYRF
jgi:D-alanine-D-alanine ligase